MKKMILTKTRQQTKTAENASAGIDSISKSSIAIMGSISALIGVWAVVSLVSAMVASGGPLGMVSNWFRAIGGM